MKILFEIEGKKLIKYTGDEELVQIPAGIEEVGRYSFAENKKIKKVFIGNDVKRIGAGALKNCTGLEYVKLIGIRELCEYAFSGCRALKTVQLRSRFENAEDVERAFYKCNSKLKLIWRELKPLEETPWRRSLISNYIELPTEKTVIIFIGIQGSGKTTYYENELKAGYEHVNLDTLHTRNKEQQAIAELVERGVSFVVDNTNPTKADRARYVPFLREKGYKIVGYFFESKIKDCIARNAERAGKARVPAAAIAATSNKLELPSKDEGFDELYFVKIESSGKVIKSKWRE